MLLWSNEKAQFLNLNDEKLGFLFWNFLNVVNLRFAGGTPLISLKLDHFTQSKGIKLGREI